MVLLKKILSVANSSIIKQVLKQIKINDALLVHRNNLISGMIISSAQMLMSRCLGIKLPATSAVLQPKII